MSLLSYSRRMWWATAAIGVAGVVTATCADDAPSFACGALTWAAVRFFVNTRGD